MNLRPTFQALSGLFHGLANRDSPRLPSSTQTSTEQRVSKPLALIQSAFGLMPIRDPDLVTANLPKPSPGEPIRRGMLVDIII